MSEHEYWQLVRDRAESSEDSDLTKREVSLDIVHVVHAAMSAGEPWAADVLTRWCEKGAAADFTRVSKDRNSVTYVRADGSKVRKTVAYSRPVRSGETAEIVGRQMQAWWDMSRASVEMLREEIFEQGERLADVLAALDQLLGAMDRHPECSSAREAWEADGRSVGEIDLGAVAL